MDPGELEPSVACIQQLGVTDELVVVLVVDTVFEVDVGEFVGPVEEDAPLPLLALYRFIALEPPHSSVLLPVQGILHADGLVGVLEFWIVLPQ